MTACGSSASCGRSTSACTTFRARRAIAHRREARQNLRSAAQDVGTTDALRNIGTSAQLADAYLAAEFGDRPRHSSIAAGLWAATSMLVVTAILTDAANGFAAGIAAANQHATGTYHWGGLSLLQSGVTAKAVDGPHDGRWRRAERRRLGAVGRDRGGGWPPVARPLEPRARPVTAS